jgi:hypothetical protein
MGSSFLFALFVVLALFLANAEAFLPPSVLSTIPTTTTTTTTATTLTLGDIHNFPSLVLLSPDGGGSSSSSSGSLELILPPADADYYSSLWISVGTGKIDWSNPVEAVMGGITLLYFAFSIGAGVKYFVKDGWRPKL